MDNCILVGNGLNRCLLDGLPWGDLLEDVADFFNVSYEAALPMPLEFERIINEYLAMNTSKEDRCYIYDEVKKRIADRVSEVSFPGHGGSIHHRLVSLKPDAILTTNYDTLIEQAIVPDYKYKKRGPKKKYLFSATDNINGMDMYHIHGITGKPESLCLGYEHYMGVVEKLRSSINTKKEKRPENMRILRVLRYDEKPTNEWGERFYTSNISIIGLELSECEADLWWLITHRAFLYYSNYFHARNYLRNRITFYDTLNEQKTVNENDLRKNDEKKLRHRLLKNQHVDVKVLTIGKDCENYKEAYSIFIDMISDEMHSS